MLIQYASILYCTQILIYVYKLNTILIHYTIEMSKFLNSPTPDQLQQIYHFGWLLSPLLIIALGSYCFDSKNSFCFFPGMYIYVYSM